MRTIFLSALLAVCLTAAADTTAPLTGNWVKPTDPHIQYVGRISFQHPERPEFNYPGTQIIAAFQGTRAQVVCKPGSGYFMAQVDEAEPFKIAFRGQRDSVVTVATALQPGHHVVRLMYCIEGYELRPDFRGFVFDGPVADAPALPTRNIEFVGNSITCGYGNEDTQPDHHFTYETENHYYSYAQLTARALGAKAHIVARSGIGAYRNYGGPKTGTPDNRMPVQYEYTLYAEKSGYRTRSKSEAEKWDFARFTPHVVCVNLGTNDLSTNNYDTRLLKQGYKTLLRMIRRNNPDAKIVFLTGTMLQGRELDICKQLLNEVADEARRGGDPHVYRFDMTPQGALGYGADWHPSLRQHQQMADELTAYLRQLMQWQ